MLVLILPAISAIWFGLRAKRLGLENGRVPFIIGIVVVAGSVFQSILGLVGKALAG
jgi:hypothetical protein